MSEIANVSRRLPALLRAENLSIVPSSINIEARTVDVVASTGAAVLRYDWWEGEYYEECLSLDPGHCRLDRLNAGASVLNSHWSWDLGEVIGVVVRSWIEGGELCATLKISNRDEKCEGYWKDIQAGIIRHISIGYRVRKYEITKEEGKLTRWRAVDWEPYEVSFVPIPADPGAGVRSFGIELVRCAPNPMPENCVFVRQASEEVSMAEVTRSTGAPAPTPTPAQPQPQLSPEQRLQRLEQLVEQQTTQNLRLMEENGRLRAEVDQLRLSGSQQIATEVDSRAATQFTEDRAAGKHYWYASEEAARSDFNNNKARYDQFCGRAPVNFVAAGGNSQQRSQTPEANASRQQLRAPSAPAQLPSSNDLRPSDDGNEVYRSVIKIQQEAAQQGRTLDYSQATEEYHRRVDLQAKLAR